MSKQEELFNEYHSLANQFKDLSSIVQNCNNPITWSQAEEFHHNFDRLLRNMSSMRSKTLLFLKDEGLITK